MTDSFRKGNHEEFHQYIAAYDKEVAPSLRARGYKCVNKSERTVLFIYGEVTFKRNRWYKDGKCYVPVDEKLGLRKNERYSKELLFQITELASMMPYRAVVRVVEMMYNISITPISLHYERLILVATVGILLLLDRLFLVATGLFVIGGGFFLAFMEFYGLYLLFTETSLFVSEFQTDG